MLDISLIFQLFILLNPMSSFPVLVSAYRKKLDIRAIVIGSIGVAFVVAVCIILMGPMLFWVFGITIDSFRVAGGIILFILGLDTVRESNSVHSVDELDSLISIIATPLLTGPATISFIAIKVYEVGQMDILINTSIAFIIVGAVFYTFSLMLPKINLKLVNIASKVLGLFITAVAIEMIAAGINQLLNK